jgi:hypothetical protein
LATSFSRGSTRQFSYNIPDIGSFIELKVGILGNDGWRLTSMTALYGGASYRWNTNTLLDGNSAQRSKLLLVEGSACLGTTGCGSATVYTSHVAGAQTANRVAARLCGSAGCGPTRRIGSGTLAARRTYSTGTRALMGIGTFQNMTISLSGNDGITIAEFAATIEGATYRWLTPTTLDGNSRPPRPSVMLSVSTAYTQLTGSGTTFNITTITSSTAGSETGNRQNIVIYGSNGFVGPLTLGNRFGRGATNTRSFNIPNIGNFIELKITNTGNDGWKPDKLTASYGTLKRKWTYGAFIDGNGNTNTPHADVFVVAQAACAAGPTTYVYQTTMCAEGAFILSSSECATAAAKMLPGGLGTLTSSTVNSAGSSWASGCLVHNGQLYFSPHVPGSSNSATNGFICHTTPAQPYGTSPTHCGPGNGMLTSAQCTTAATSLYSVSSVTTAGTAWASVCLRHNGNTIYYSSHSAGTTQNPTSSYLCNVC